MCFAQEGVHVKEISVRKAEQILRERRIWWTNATDLWEYEWSDDTEIRVAAKRVLKQLYRH